MNSLIYKRVPAAHPMQVVFKSNDLFGTSAVFNYRINDAGTDYGLYANKNYSRFPHNGDPYGIITQVVRLARLADSGVLSIRVTSHEVSVNFSDAIKKEQRIELLRKAIRSAGLGVSC